MKWQNLVFLVAVGTIKNSMAILYGAVLYRTALQSTEVSEKSVVLDKQTVSLYTIEPYGPRPHRIVHLQ
jgi:hypothetical protein